MPIDPSRALGATLPATSGAWTEADVILYHLGIGAGARATDAAELEYAYEARLKVLPTFGVIPAFGALDDLASVPGLQFDMAQVLHGEQELELHGPIPTAAEVETTGRVAALYDKGKAAVVVLETETTDGGGRSLFTNRFSLFLRGEGGFGGDRGPSGGAAAGDADGVPEREPDAVVESPTLPQQALLYRLSGDRNPLHADPAVAATAGFDRPILHGLCTYGVVCKAVVDAVLDGDVARVARYRARFAGVVFPGETIVTSVWREGDLLVVEAGTKERGSPALAHAAIALR